MTLLFTDYFQTIYTRYAEPKVRTGIVHKRSKIVAKVPGRRTSVNTEYDHDLTLLQNHEVAARHALSRKFDASTYELLGYGDALNENGYAFVFKKVKDAA